MKIIKSVFIKTTCLLILILVSNSFSLIQAQTVFYPVSANEIKDNIRFVNVENDMLVFELNLKDLPVKGSTLTIKDEASNLLLEQKIVADTFRVLYKIVRNDISKITFEVVSSNRVFLNKSFSINRWIEEKIEVAKL